MTSTSTNQQPLAANSISNSTSGPASETVSSVNPPALLQALACGAGSSSRPDRTPVWFMRQAGRSLPEYKQARAGTTMIEACLNPELTCEITLQPVRRYQVDAAIFFSDIITPLNLAGVAVDIKPGVGPVFENPVRSVEDVNQLVAHDDFDPWAITRAAQLVCAELPANTPLIGFAGAPFTLAAYLVEGGPSKNYLRTRALAQTDPQAWHKLAAWCAKLSTKFLLAQVEGGARAIQLFDSWVGNLSVADYESNCLPYSQQIFTALRQAQINGIHFGVGTAHLLKQMQAAGPAAVGIDWRVPLDQAVEQLRKPATEVAGLAGASSIVVQGNLDPAVLRCPPEIVFSAVDRVLQQGLHADAHIFNLGHGVPPDTDPGVLAEVVARVHDFHPSASNAPDSGISEPILATKQIAPRTNQSENTIPIAAEKNEQPAPSQSSVELANQSLSDKPSKDSQSEPVDLQELSKCDALFLGGGLAALTGAYRLQKQGAKVAIVEERGRPGGLICSGKFDDFTFDIGAEAFLSNATAVSELCQELGLEVVEPAGSSWIWRHDPDNAAGGQAFPIPHGILGIPASYDDPTYRQALTEEEWERFRQEEQLDPTVGSEAQNLADMVAIRFGKAVLDKIVAPVAGGIHSASPNHLNLDTVAPALRAGLAKYGSLVKAVAALRGEKPTKSAVCAPVGGMFQLVEVLAKRIVAGGGIILPHVQALSLQPAGDDYLSLDHAGWSVRVTATKSGAHPGTAPIPVGKPVTVTVPQVVVALPGEAARKLLMENLPLTLSELPKGGPIRHISLWVDCPELDTHPRGSGMLVQHPTGFQSMTEWGERPLPMVGAKAITHYTAKWDWAAQQAPSGRHLLRVSYGWAKGPEYPITVEQAVADASRLLGVSLTTSQVRASKIIYWDGCLPPFTSDHRQQVERLLAQVDHYPGLEIIGSWVAGSGIAGVVSQASQLQMRGLDLPVRGSEDSSSRAKDSLTLSGAAGSLGQSDSSKSSDVANLSGSAGPSILNNPVQTGKPDQQIELSPETTNGLRLGTRASLLAKTQSQQVADRLRNLGVNTELKLIKTAGDLSKQSLKTLGGIGVFAATLRLALLDQQCELAVHSYKDLPTAPVAGLQIAAVPVRELINDFLCSSAGWDVFQLPVRARIGTGSPRRASQLLALRPDLEIVDIRGNVPTRLARVKGMTPMVNDRTDLGGPAALHAAAHPDLDAVVLAGAGLKRLELGTDFAWPIPWQLMLPAPAQGALAIETRTDLDQHYPQLVEALQGLDNLPTRLAVTAERAVLAALEAGCAAPIGTYANFDSTTGILSLTARVLSTDGTHQAQQTSSCLIAIDSENLNSTLTQATGLGEQVAEGLLDKGAARFTDLQATKTRGDQ